MTTSTKKKVETTYAERIGLAEIALKDRAAEAHRAYLTAKESEAQVAEILEAAQDEYDVIEARLVSGDQSVSAGDWMLASAALERAKRLSQSPDRRAAAAAAQVPNLDVKVADVLAGALADVLPANLPIIVTPVRPTAIPAPAFEEVPILVVSQDKASEADGSGRVSGSATANLYRSGFIVPLSPTLLHHGDAAAALQPGQVRSADLGNGVLLDILAVRVIGGAAKVPTISGEPTQRALDGFGSSVMGRLFNTVKAPESRAVGLQDAGQRLYGDTQSASHVSTKVESIHTDDEGVRSVKVKTVARIKPRFDSAPGDALGRYFEAAVGELVGSMEPYIGRVIEASISDLKRVSGDAWEATVKTTFTSKVG